MFTGTTEPSEFRGGGSRTSLLASSTTVKALASAWHDLKYGFRWEAVGGRTVGKGYVADPWDGDRIVKAFANLPSMDAGSDKVLNRFWKSLNVSGSLVVNPWARPPRRRRRPALPLPRDRRPAVPTPTTPGGAAAPPGAPPAGPAWAAAP